MTGGNRASITWLAMRTFRSAGVAVTRPDTAASAAALTGKGEGSPPGGGGAAQAQALASPAVRRVARELGVGLGAIAGTGPDGRITREDVERCGVGRGQRM
jgi:pyruvate dehydrogenase E2 component (dihydrolipoamide acetyltransferase)